MDPRTVPLGADRVADRFASLQPGLARQMDRACPDRRACAAVGGAAGERRRRGISLEDVLGMAASVRGVSIDPGESALDVLLTKDSGASLRGCLVAARYNATHVAPVEVIRTIGEAIQTLDDADDPPDSPEDVAALMLRVLDILDRLHQAIEEAWFHSDVMSEEEVYRRFVQQ